MKGLISPAAFIATAEENGLILQIGEWVLHEACATAARWPDHLKVAINLSVSQFRDSSLLQRLQETLAQAGLRPQRLEIEVTESIFLADNIHGVPVLKAMKDIGVRVAIDDFGTGQSSLAQLQHLPADELKIDKSFVLTLQPGSAEEELVRIAVELGHRFGMQVIAEGIETPAGLAVLQELGCDLGQGYLFSRPMAGADLPGWCSRFDGWQPLSVAGDEDHRPVLGDLAGQGCERKSLVAVSHPVDRDEAALLSGSVEGAVPVRWHGTQSTEPL